MFTRFVATVKYLCAIEVHSTATHDTFGVLAQMWCFFGTL